MRHNITLVRNGVPLVLSELIDGDEVIYEAASGNVLAILDRDGAEKWRSTQEPSGKTAHMIAERKEPQK